LSPILPHPTAFVPRAVVQFIAVPRIEPVSG